METCNVNKLIAGIMKFGVNMEHHPGMFTKASGRLPVLLSV